jgi:hypothetical protein
VEEAGKMVEAGVETGVRLGVQHRLVRFRWMRGM